MECNIPFTDTKSFFTLSKFVPRGSVRVSSVVQSANLESVAFVTPQKQVVAVVMNTGEQPVTFKLVDTALQVTQAVKVTALAHSIQTFIYA